MARQSGILKIKGTIGGMTFYKTSLDGDLVREKGGVDGQRIANDPAFARTRENGAEFGTAGGAGKLLRDVLRTLLLSAADSRVTSRVTQLMSDIAKLDLISPRGERHPSVGLATPEGKALLKGFNFNLNAPIGGILYKPFSLNLATGVITISNLVPINDIVRALGATHVNIVGGFATVDFETGAGELEMTNAVLLPIDGVATNVILTPDAIPTGPGVKLHLLKLEFSQLVNGVQYSLKNGAFNALSIIEVA
jgi:hypothetical protein